MHLHKRTVSTCHHSLSDDATWLFWAASYLFAVLAYQSLTNEENIFMNSPHCMHNAHNIFCEHRFCTNNVQTHWLQCNALIEICMHEVGLWTQSFSPNHSICRLCGSPYNLYTLLLLLLLLFSLHRADAIVAIMWTLDWRQPVCIADYNEHNNFYYTCIPPNS